MNEMEDDLEVSKMLPQIEIGFDEHIAEIDTQHERFEKMRSYSDEFGQKPKYEPLEFRVSSKVEVKDPRWLGNSMALFYRNHNPLITIGPHCKTTYSYSYIDSFISTLSSSRGKILI